MSESAGSDRLLGAFGNLNSTGFQLLFLMTKPVSSLYLVGPQMVKKLGKLNISTIDDLLNHYPARYQDFRLISDINKIQAGETVTVKAKIINFSNVFTKWGKNIQKILTADKTGELEIIFFNQVYLSRVFKPEMQVNFSGKVSSFNNKTALISPEFEIVKDVTIHTGRLVPVYPETYGVSSKWLRSRIFPLTRNLKIIDYLPTSIKENYNLIDLSQAYQQIHFPDNWEEQQKAKQRLAFDELFLLQLRSLIHKQNWSKQKVTKKFTVDRKRFGEFFKKIPFKLTLDQEKALQEILIDLQKSIPANRLLQGDVGCGKTVVAAGASYLAFLNQTQTAYMAPTEILANQHYSTFKKLLEPLGVKIGLVTGNKKSEIMNCDIIIGTHALIQKKISFKNLGLVIIDEQHRFGVEQRANLINKGTSPHILTMTATPIPRTVALTLYADLDMSVISQMPQGRIPVKTWVVPLKKRSAAYAWIKERLLKKEQAFIVCPIIDLSESLQDVKAASEEFKTLQKEFSGFKLGLLHGRLKTLEKNQVIAKFFQGKLDILVSTPVVEVGIDIPRATIMVIEAGERFGLASLHQLRGRVGRRKKQGYCLLFSTNKKESSRLQLMEKYTNGLKLAEMDLKFRGPGEIYGKNQHGFANLKIASFSDLDLITQAKKAAGQAAETLDKLPLLKQKLKKDTIKTYGSFT